MTMAKYENIEKELWRLRSECVNGIIETLHEKGYEDENTCYSSVGGYKRVEITNEKYRNGLIISIRGEEKHADNWSIEDLLEAFEAVLTCVPYRAMGD